MGKKVGPTNAVYQKKVFCSTGLSLFYPKVYIPWGLYNTRIYSRIYRWIKKKLLMSSGGLFGPSSYGDLLVP